MYMEVAEYNIRFVDSLNFLQMPLSAFPKTFGLDELKIGFFQHYFNKKANANYKGPMPSKTHYGCNQMKTGVRENFLKWYDEKVKNNYVFDFQKEILEYCRSDDVDILRRSILKFREDFIQLENIDPLRYMTIASVCMAIYRANCIKENEIGIVDEYDKTDSFSRGSIIWLDYMAQKYNIKIQHALSGGEKTIDKYKVDGYCKSNKTVYEDNGCFWYGCQNCFRGDIFNTKNKKR